MRTLTERGVIFQNGSQVYDPHDPMSKMVMTILAAAAEAEGGWISHRTKEAMARPSVRAKLKGRQTLLKPSTDAEIAAQLAAGRSPRPRSPRPSEFPAAACTAPPNATAPE
jgi:DNA invertase Pin-like site-specific DNA recombinase